MRKRPPLLALLPVVTLLAACQTLPPREEMLALGCSHAPCREAGALQLHDDEGRVQTFHVPAGPVFAGGILSIVLGETHYLGISHEGTDDGRLKMQWMNASDRGEADLRLTLQRISTGDGYVSRLTIHNQLDHALWLEAEQFPVNQDRFYPLSLPPVPAQRRVHREWPHTILEVQLTGIRRLDPARRP
ncbi:hypothetical protein [Natronospira bacteriovora]|uniref:Lipoprotein n=1 Tax=Natronospira bacteriovora TaxID=3069753 RepID=A0ABU0W316_9GAMM|nr:hypothetical protein [Natronospira sp. AB-CW4]MDQ2068409.1 hypothetical protein [Natronospira sp. AB-CW4]